MKKLLYVFFAGALLFNSACDPEDGKVETNVETLYESQQNSACNCTQVTVTDKGQGTGTITWTKDKVYILNGMVFVNSGQTLTIEPGTVIKGEGGQGEEASALIIAKGGKIMAEGTASMPIIFTSTSDPVYRDESGVLQNEASLSATTRGLWGGLIVLGNARLNSSPGSTAIEGIPTSDSRGIYGGSDDTDNSGVLKYVSIRHGGTDIGAGNEINGLTLGGVGSGTTVDFIEIFGNVDDGVEFFGGTVNTKHLITAYCGDDAVDYDEGYRGMNQFLIAYQATDAADRGGEHDGGTDPEDGTPYATPRFYNVTSVGKPTSRSLTFRDNAGGVYANSIFAGYSKAIDIEDLASGEDSYKRFEAGDLKFMNNIFLNIGAGTTAEKLFTITFVGSHSAADSAAHKAAFSDHFSAQNNNALSDVTLTGVVPSGADVTTNLAAYPDPFYSSVSYKGAVDPSAAGKWYEGWTRFETVLP